MELGLRFDFIEESSNRKFHAQKVIQTNGELAFAVSWTENDMFSTELFSLEDVKANLQSKSWIKC